MSKFSEKKPQNVIFSSMKSDISERDYYMIKINNKFKKLNELLITSVIIGIIDLFSIDFSDYLFKNILYKITISSFFIWSSFCLLLYKISYINIEVVNSYSYNKLVLCIYISIIICCLMEINLMYILIFKVFINYNKWIKFIVDALNNFQTICSIFSFSIFVLVNSVIPFIWIISLKKIQKFFIIVANIQRKDFDESNSIKV